jgi:hypothetical protein
LVVKNITGLNQTNSFNNPVYLEGVEFRNSTTTFNCFLSRADCPAIFENLTFADAVYLNSLLQSGNFVLLNEILEIRNNAFIDAVEAAMNLLNANVTGTICAANFAPCSNTSVLGGVNISDGTIVINAAVIQNRTVANNAIITITSPFFVTFFAVVNATVQTYQGPSFSNAPAFMDLSFHGDNVGVGFSDDTVVNYNLHVNGTFGTQFITFNSSAISHNTPIMDGFEYYVFNTTLYGPWSLNYSVNFVINRMGNQMSMEFPQEFNATAVRNSTISSRAAIPARFLPYYNTSQYFYENIVVTSDASYNGLPGIFRLNPDGTFTIFATNPTSASTTFSNSGIATTFTNGNPAGIKSNTVSWIQSFVET